MISADRNGGFWPKAAGHIFISESRLPTLLEQTELQHDLP